MKMKKKSQRNFLDYTGKVKQNNGYYEFEMNDSSIIKSVNYLKAYNPTFDNLFKKVFRDEKILLNFLNDLLYPKEKKIKSVIILNTNFNGPYGKNGVGAINLDMFCACIFDKDTTKENKSTNSINSSEASSIFNCNKKYDLVVDIEMQRVLTESPTKRFLKYMSYIDSGILKEKALIIVLVIKNSIGQTDNISAEINYSKKSIPRYKIRKEYDDNIIIEIDLNHCFNLIEKKKEIWILDKDKNLTKKGKEWIKLLTLQIWCQSFQEEIYSLPNLENLYFFQPQIKTALQYLNVDIPLYSLYIYQEKEELNKGNELEDLKKENKKLEDEKEKITEEKEKLEEKNKKLEEKNKKYKMMLISNGLYEEDEDEEDIEQKEEKDDLDYYEDAKDSNDDDDDDDELNNDGNNNNNTGDSGNINNEDDIDVDNADDDDESYKPEEDEEDNDMDLD